jgi:D-lactate dehydrogenase
VKLAEGFEGISIFTTDNASDTVLEKLYLCGVRYIALRSVGSDNVDIKKQELWSKWQTYPRTPTIAEHAVTLLLALNRKIILGQNSCKWATTVWIIWLVLTRKKVGIMEPENRRRFCKIMHGFGFGLSRGK